MCLIYTLLNPPSKSTDNTYAQERNLFTYGYRSKGEANSMQIVLTMLASRVGTKTFNPLQLIALFGVIRIIILTNKFNRKRALNSV